MLPIKNKIFRGEILRVLAKSMPQPICDNVMFEVFNQEEEKEVVVQLKYLEQKKYIRLEDVDEEFSTAKIIVHILPLGVDLLDRNIPADPGITCPKI